MVCTSAELLADKKNPRVEFAFSSNVDGTTAGGFEICGLEALVGEYVVGETYDVTLTIGTA